jgi:hypothetical protein
MCKHIALPRKIDTKHCARQHLGHCAFRDDLSFLGHGVEYICEPAFLKGSARVSRVGFGVAPKRTFLWISSIACEGSAQGKVRDREDALANTRDACASGCLGFSILSDLVQ